MNMRHQRYFYTVLCLVLFTLGTTTVLYSQSKATIGLQVRFKAPAGPLENATTVYFVKLANDSDAIQTKELIASTFIEEDQIYLTDAAPGTYAMVAVGIEKNVPGAGSRTLLTFLSEALVKESMVTVSADDFVYMGDYTLHTKMMTKKRTVDATQYYYFTKLTGKEKIPRYMQQIALDTWFYSADAEDASIDKTQQHLFYENAVTHFKELPEGRILQTKLVPTDTTKAAPLGE